MDEISVTELTSGQKSTGNGYPVSPSADGRVMMGQDIQIFPDKPLQEFASFEMRAFEAKDSRLSGTQIAIICSRSSAPRITSVIAYRDIKTVGLLKLVSAGIIYWPSEQRQYFAMIFEMPPPRKMMGLQDALPVLLPEDKIISSFIKPIVSALLELKNVNIVHGGICSDNIFITGDSGVETAVLGECLTSPAFFRLHPFFETISRSMAQPSGRGGGTSKNDMYALGMCVALLIRRQNTFLGKSAEDIIAKKIEYGSYSYAMGGQKAHPNLSEFLRAVLNDDEAARWDAEDVKAWLEDNKKENVKASLQTPMAARPFSFRDAKYWDMRTLCMSFSEHIPEAVAEIKNGQVLLWAKRNFDDKELLARYNEALQKEEASGPERLVTSVTMAMDPKAPVRYRGVAVLPDGFGTALCDAIARGNDIQPYGDILVMQYMSAWLEQRRTDIGDATLLIATFEKCRSFLTQKIKGYGLERVAYLLNKEAPCLSPFIRDFFVFTPGQLLLALESLSRRQPRPENIYDRHVAAFLSIREPKVIDPFLGNIISPDPANRVLGYARSLAAIQRRYNTGPVPGIGNWLISMMQPAIQNYRDHDLRAEMGKRLNKLMDNGDLQKLLDLVDSNALIQEDSQRFLAAVRDFRLMTEEKAYLQKALNSKGGFGAATGRQTAMLVSVIISLIATACLILLHFVQRI